MLEMPPDRRVLRALLRQRRFAVPASMVDQATERRQAGDWRGACAAAGIAADIDLDAAARRYGAEVAAAVEDDLRHLVPDLVRWHLVKEPGFDPWEWYQNFAPLAAYPGGLRLMLNRISSSVPPTPLVLTVAEPGWAPHPLFDADRYLWDSRHTGELRAMCGPEPLGTDARCPHATGRSAEAAEAAGIDAAELGEAPAGAYHLSRAAVDWSRLVPAARTLLAAYGRRGEVVNLGVKAWLDLAPPRPKLLAGPPPPGRGPSPELLPLERWSVPLDAELLRHGLIDPGELHPLVHAALLPGRGYRRAERGSPVHAVVPVQCGDATHRLVVRDRDLHAVDHDDDTIRRELALLALAGPAAGCAVALHRWRTGHRELPDALQDLHDELWQRIRFGDTDGVLSLLEAGFPPVGDDTRRTVLHALRSLEYERALPRLLALGLDLEARDRAGRTPLQYLLYQAPDRLDAVEALLRAGADPDRPGYRGMSALDEWGHREPIRALLQQRSRRPDPAGGAAGESKA